MIEQQALVMKLRGEQVVIKMLRKNACQSCELGGACGTGSLGRMLGYREQRLLIKNDHNLVVGDRITVGVDEKYFIYAGFLMYLVPLICLFMFAILTDYLFDATQWINVVASLLGLVFGLMMTSRLSNRTFVSKMEPRFMRHDFPVETVKFSPV